MICPTTKEQWRELFDAEKADTRKDQMLVVLNHLDGYAIEYGIDEDADAEALIAAFDAITEWWSKDTPKESYAEVRARKGYAEKLKYLTDD